MIIMEIFLEKVTKDKKDVLYRLLQYSLYEESENDLREVNEEGIFEYKYFDLYFTEDDRDAYFIKEVDTNKILGFAMVNTYMQIFNNGHCIAEFMIMPKYRRNKIGSTIAILLFDMYRGNWEVSPSDNSEKAYSFWKNVIEEYTNNYYEFKDGIFIFRSE